jgi:NADH-quinone oxidoreductase subunit E
MRRRSGPELAAERRSRRSREETTGALGANRKPARADLTFTPENLARFEATLRGFPPEHRRAALLPALWLAHEQEGYLGLKTLEYVAGLLGLSPAEVLEVASYYNMFRLEPGGRHHFQVCTNLSCSLRGARRIVDWLRQRLSIEVGEVTPDGRFMLSTVQCLGSCDTAPMMMLDDHYEENLSTEALERIVERLP